MHPTSGGSQTGSSCWYLPSSGAARGDPWVTKIELSIALGGSYKDSWNGRRILRGRSQVSVWLNAGETVNTFSTAPGIAATASDPPNANRMR